MPDPTREGKNALMPVSPSDKSTEMEGLSRDGETGEKQEDAEIQVEGSEKDEEEQEEGRASLGQKPPEEPTKLSEKNMERRIVRIAAGVSTA